jgi:hypothetical protein
VLFAPILFKDLGDYRFLKLLDGVSHHPVEVLTPFKATVLLGKCIHRTEEDLAGRTAVMQRQLRLVDVIALRKRVASMIRNG